MGKTLNGPSIDVDVKITKLGITKKSIIDKELESEAPVKKDSKLEVDNSVKDFKIIFIFHKN